MEPHFKGRIVLSMVVGLLVMPAVVHADWIILIDGTTHDGVITEITGDRIVLSKGRDQRTFLRVFIREIGFEKSDLLVLSSGDTLTGRILRQDNDQIHVALRDSVKIVVPHEVTRIFALQGPPFSAREVTRTDESFRFENPNPPVSLPPIRISFSLGAQDFLYSFSGNSFVGPEPFEKSLRGSLLRIEAGASINKSIDLMIGLSWAKALTYNPNTSGHIMPEVVHYTSLHAAGLYSVYGWKRRVGVFGRLQVGVLSGSTPLNEGDMVPSVTPGLGLVLSPSPSIQLILEADFPTARVSVDQIGNAINGGLILWGVVSIDFSIFSSSATSAKH